MYIPIHKIEETEDAALYAFRIEEWGWGRFWIDRRFRMGANQQQRTICAVQHLLRGAADRPPSYP